MLNPKTASCPSQTQDHCAPSTLCAESGISALIPPYAHAILNTLESAGYESWIVGGFVRDALRGVPSADVDIATAATWQDVQRVCEACGMRTHETGTKHGTITVVVPAKKTDTSAQQTSAQKTSTTESANAQKDDHPTQPNCTSQRNSQYSSAVEVTTFRIDGASYDARHPSQVEFTRSITQDLARRDFTINALAYHPERGIFDPFGGMQDLQQGIIRTVGNPAQRFSEDALRILRACRFVAQLGFTIEEETLSEMYANKGLLTRISAERTYHELSRLLLGEYAGRALVQTVDALAAVLPELVACKGFEQHTPYHIYDVLEHIAHVVDGVPAYPLVRWAALFHDLGKPAAFFTDSTGQGHFYGHALISVELARGIMGRLKMASSFQSRVLALVERHDDTIEPTPKAVRRVLSRLDGDTELFRALCDLKRGDARGQSALCANRIALADELIAVLDSLEAQESIFTLKDLAVNGRDARSVGIEQGPLIGRALNAALDAVIEETVPNSHDELVDFLDTWNKGLRGFAS